MRRIVKAKTGKCQCIIKLLIFSSSKTLFIFLCACTSKMRQVTPTYKHSLTYPDNFKNFGFILITKYDWIWDLRRWLIGFSMGVKWNSIHFYYLTIPNITIINMWKKLIKCSNITNILVDFNWILTNKFLILTKLLIGVYNNIMQLIHRFLLYW